MVTGAILVCHTIAPVAAFNAYRFFAPSTYTVDAPVSGSGTTAAVEVIPRPNGEVTPLVKQLSSARLHRSVPVDSLSE